MYNGDEDVPGYQVPHIDFQQRKRKILTNYKVIITEQPTSTFRFRYKCEGRLAGSIVGASSIPENITYPSIKVVGGPPRKAIVIVSCVTEDYPHKPHPHYLVGREGCEHGICTLNIPVETMSITFTNLGIQSVKKKDFGKSFEKRQRMSVDPFKSGFTHVKEPIDINTVRLCFQVFLVDENTSGKYICLPPKVSVPIYNKKNICDLKIVKLSHCVSYVDGGREDIILLCEKVEKNDIEVRFYEVQNSNVVWLAYADVRPQQVHKDYAISFKTPKYKRLDVTEPVKVYIQLRRPSNNDISDPLPFQLLPSGIPKKKRPLDTTIYDDLLLIERNSVPNISNNVPGPSGMKCYQPPIQENQEWNSPSTSNYQQHDLDLSSVDSGELDSRMPNSHEFMLLNNLSQLDLNSELGIHHSRNV